VSRDFAPDAVRQALLASRNGLGPGCPQVEMRAKQPVDKIPPAFERRCIQAGPPCA